MISTIADALSNLDNVRNDRNEWKVCAHRKAESEERGSYDGNELERHRYLIALQYRYEPGDEDFIRYLFDQEVLACQRDSFHGCGDAMLLAAFLLSRFKRPQDFWRFAEAKCANFDTACAFDAQFLLSSGIKDALAIFAESNHPLKESVPDYIFDDNDECRYSQDDMLEWETQQSAWFPRHIKDESARVWIDRAIQFHCLEEGRRLLDEWEVTHTDESPSTLCHLRPQLGDIPNAILLQHVKLDAAVSPWDKVSAAQSLAELYVENTQPMEAWKIVEAHSRELDRIEDWGRYGLGRMLVKTTFDIAKASPIHAASQAAFSWACEREAQLDWSTLAILETAVAASELVGDVKRASHFRAAAAAEKTRIEEEVRKAFGALK